MKYCPRCKVRMGSEAVTCAECGGPLRVIGGTAAAALPGNAPVGPQAELMLTLKGLEHEVTRSKKFTALMAGVAGALLLLLLVVLTFWHFSHVMQYAVLGRVDVVPSDTGTANITYDTNSEGKVEFVRQSAGRTETLTEYVDGTKSDTECKFEWAGKSGDSYTIRVRSRVGWHVVEQSWPSRP